MSVRLPSSSGRTLTFRVNDTGSIPVGSNFYLLVYMACSLMVKLFTHNERVIGSNPIRPKFYIVFNQYFCNMLYYYFFELFYQIVLFIIIILCMLITVAFFTVYERKFLAAVHQRVGPNIVGPLGLLQAIADGVKLFLKEFIMPLRANRVLFVFSPMLVFFLSLMSWLVMPFGSGVVISNINLGVIFLLLISSLNVYGVVLSG